MNIAIIMDGNRRFAAKNLLSTLSGHQNGFKNLLNIASIAPKFWVKTLTLYALSTENFKNRDSSEIANICMIVQKGLEQYSQKLIDDKVKVEFLGNLTVFSPELQELIESITTRTRDNTLLTLQICLNYGGRDEIVQAVNKLLNKTEVSEEDITNALYTPIEPDLIIRTGGDIRLSNFLTWQSVYSELYFTDKLWPEFTQADFAEAINEYRGKKRRFGS